MKDTLSKYFQGDKVIWAAIGVMFIFSLLAVYSASGTLAYKYMEGDTTYYFFRHFAFLAVGFVIIYMVHKIPYRFFSRISQWLFVMSIPLLILTLLVGISRNEAARWLTVPGIGIDFQTSDLAKFALIMYTARLLAQNQDSELQLTTIFKTLIINIAVICLLIFPANFSTAAILFATSYVLLFIGRIPQKLLLRTAGYVAAGMIFLVMLIFLAPDVGRFGTWKNRIVGYVSEDKTGDNTTNYQVEQSKIAIVSGGIFGKGPGNSTQRNFLPHPYSDFIYAIIIEEYGAFGGLIVLSLYLYLLYRTGIIVRQSKRTFPALLAIGLTLIMVFQAMINMAVAVNLLPVTGQTLPFISMGGTSILFSSVALGIILSISRGIEIGEQDDIVEEAVPVAQKVVTTEKPRDIYKGAYE